MNEFEQLKKVNEVKEISVDEKRYHIDLDERITPHRNHTLYKVDLSNGKIKEAEYSSDLVWNIKLRKFVNENAALIKEDGFKYVSALNKDNVKKKMVKDDNGSRIDWSKEKINL
jgi:hypothetical protein